MHLFNPFDIENDRDYHIWREHKLHDYPTSLDDVIVEIDDPRSLRQSEHDALLAVCRKTNFVIYASSVTEENKDIPARLGQQFGLRHLNHNWLADEDAVTSLTVNQQGIKWHTDGYYNEMAEQIRGLILHCVRPAETGGENQLLDHDMAYIKMRDANPQFVHALMQADAMTIPERMDQDGIARKTVSGPVFSVHAQSGSLHMRYTARTRSICWKDDELTRQAVQFLENLLGADLDCIFRAKLEAGMGLLSNNILHDRSGFTDGEQHKRLLYRARYFDRISGTELYRP